MPGIPGQSKLALFDDEIKDLLLGGISYRRIAEVLNRHHDLDISHNAVYSYVKAKGRCHRFHRTFSAGLDKDLQDSLMCRIIAEWTHDSTALEGNTLTLGDTLQVLEYGLTINGKALKDHEEVRGHARAINILNGLVTAKKIGVDVLFELHNAIMPEVAVDAMNPVGTWKRDYNGTTGVVNEKTVYMEYAAPADISELMQVWLREYNKRLNVACSYSDVLGAYLWSHITFVRIHPFFDGNGRMARLLANLSVLRAGYPPLTIDVKSRVEYNKLLWEYQQRVGKVRKDKPLLEKCSELTALYNFFGKQWEHIIKLLDEARLQQKKREMGKKI